MKHVFHPEAELEFMGAVRFYKDRGFNLGQRFNSEIRATIRQIVETPERWRVLNADVRRHLVEVFPYSVLYTIEKDFILIIAHHKRAPGFWKHRLTKKFTA